MSDIQVRVTVETADVTAMILKLQDRLSPNMLKLFLIERAHRDLRTRAEQRFVSEGDDATGPWQQLAFATGMIRMYQGFQPFHPINVRTGKLRSFVLNSFTVRALARGATLTMPGDATGEIWKKFLQAQQGGASKSRRGKQYGGGTGGARTSRPSVRRSTEPLAGGGDAGPNRIAPARPVLALMSRDREMIYNDLLDWIRAGVI